MIYDTYSERERSRAATPDVYQYNEVPLKLRVQVQQILTDAIGPHYRMEAYDMSAPRDNSDTWEFVHKTLCREFGVHRLASALTEGQAVIAFLETCTPSQFIDVVEVCARVLDRLLRQWSDHDRKCHGILQKAEDALDELNYRFRKCCFGFQFVGGQAVRVDSEFLHEEVVKPALRILGAPQYEGARDEFLSAHRHYRNGDHEEAITQAAKAFESTLKIVCDKHGWAYAPGSRTVDLLKIVRAHDLWPDYLDNSFDQLLATLASGLPKVRNEQGAHGQGGLVRSTPEYVAAYALHLAAAKIVFISDAAEARTDQPALLRQTDRPS